MTRLLLALLAGALTLTGAARAHPQQTPLQSAPQSPPLGGTATYLGNEGVMVEYGGARVLFDPLYESGFGTYTEVPPEMVEAMTTATAPFDEIDAVFVSHVHDDHFSAARMIEFIRSHPDVSVFIPREGAALIRSHENWDDAFDFSLAEIDRDVARPYRISVGPLIVEPFVVDHSGMPDFPNAVYRVTLMAETGEPLTVMHLGDAETTAETYAPYAEEWASRATHTAFVPYWAYGELEAWRAVERMMQVEGSIGIHVPIDVPDWLDTDTTDFLTTPGESRILYMNQEE